MTTDALDESRRRWPLLLLGIVAIAGASAVALVVARSRTESPAGVDAPAVELITVATEQRDLLTYSTVSGTFGFETTVTLDIPRDGTVTAMAETGSVLDRGSVVIEIDREPSVVMFGSLPMWRDLEDGIDDGTDVRQLEENLAVLGFTDEGAMVIDREFDGHTEDAVEAWQEDLGLEPDGIVQVADVILLPGPAELGEPSVAVGGSARAATELSTVTVIATEQDVVHRAAPITDSVVTAMPVAVGAAVVDGMELYSVDDRPVVAFVEPETAPLVTVDRDLTLGVDDGDDVELLERRLAAYGYDSDGTLEVDRVFDEATAAALAEWQAALGIGVDEDGQADVPVVRRGEVLVIRGDRTITALPVGVGDVVSNGTVVMTAGRAVRVVTGQLPVGDLDLLEVGQSVDIELPDGTVLPGSVREIGTVATASEGGDAVVDFTIEVGDGGDETSLVAAPVTVRVLEEAAMSVTAVPVPALVAIAEGGYGVEIAEGATTRLVRVELGAFADGWVEVTNGTVAPGDEVVVAR